MTWNDLQLLRLRRWLQGSTGMRVADTHTQKKNGSTPLIVLQLKTSPRGQYPLYPYNCVAVAVELN